MFVGWGDGGGGGQRVGAGWGGDGVGLGGEEDGINVSDRGYHVPVIHVCWVSLSL